MYCLKELDVTCFSDDIVIANTCFVRHLAATLLFDTTSKTEFFTVKDGHVRRSAQNNNIEMIRYQPCQTDSTIFSTIFIINSNFIVLFQILTKNSDLVES